MIIADGRNHVELTDRTYDFIVVDPPPPIESSGVSVISSLEFYQAGEGRLDPGGVMMQWVPYGQTLDEFLAHVRTFLPVFPNVIVAAGRRAATGSSCSGPTGPIDFDEASIREVLARPGHPRRHRRRAFDSPKLDVDGWVGAIPQLIRLTGDQVAAFAGAGPAHHRRPAAARVLLPPPLARDPVAAPVAGPGPRALTRFGPAAGSETRPKGCVGKLPGDSVISSTT